MRRWNTDTFHPESVGIHKARDFSEIAGFVLWNSEPWGCCFLRRVFYTYCRGFQKSCRCFKDFDGCIAAAAILAKTYAR